MADRTEELAIIVRVQDLASRALKSVNRELGGMEKGTWAAGRAATRGLGNAVHNIERLAIAGAGAALAGGAAAVKMAMDYESSAASVRKTVNGDVAGILADIRKMATTTPVDVNDLNEIAAAAGALGVAKGDIVEFTRTVALLGVTTDVTTEEAATSLGHLKTNLRLTGPAFHEVGDELVYLGNNGASTESQILGLAEAISGVAGNVGLSKEAVLGWGAAVANTGEEVEAGGTSIQKFFLTAAKAARTGGSELKTFARVSGVSAKEFSQSFERDASGTMERFIVRLGKLSKGEQQAVLELLGFNDSRITRALFKLLGNTDNLTQSLNDAGHAAGAMGKEAEQRFKTTASQVQLFKNNVKDAAITIGSELMPEINALLGEGTHWLQGHPEEIKQAAVAIAGGFRDAVQAAKQLDWEAIGGGLRLAASGAKLALDFFNSMPDFVKVGVVTGWGLNKLTGGALVDVGGALGKGVIGGLAGSFAGGIFSRGASPANPMWVAQVGGAGGAAGLAGATGAWATVGKVIGGAFAIVAAAELADLIHGAISPAGGLQGRTETNTLLPGDQLAWPFGPKNTPHVDLGPFKNILGGDSSFTAPVSNAPNAVVAGGFDSRVVGPDPNITLGGFDKRITTPIVGAIAHEQSALHRDLVGLKAAKTEEEIRKAAKKIGDEIVVAGHGNLAATRASLAALKEKLEHTHDPKTAAVLRAEIARVERKVVGREWIQRQLDAAHKINESTKSVKEKVAGLRQIQQELLSHGDTSAARIVARLITINNSVKLVRNAIGGIRYGGTSSAKTGKDDVYHPPATSTRTGATSGGLSPDERDGRADGGMAYPGRIYRVNERRDEYFEPVVPTRIHSNAPGLMSAGGARQIMAYLTVNLAVHVASKPVIGLRELTNKTSAELRYGKLSAG